MDSSSHTAEAHRTSEVPPVPRTPLPGLFVSHGSPMFAVRPSKAGPLLTELGRRLPPLLAVLVLSPHWSTDFEVEITAGPQPETIHDFGGFPDELYRLRYPAPGAPEVARLAAEILAGAGVPVRLNTEQGLDHGAWVPLMHLLPEAKVPVVQISMPSWANPAGAFALGQTLAPLAAEGVLLVGSGSLTHNLRDVFGSMRGRAGVGDPGYVDAFRDWIRQQLQAGDVEAILDYRRRAPDAARAHPTEEHFVGLPFALGAGRLEEGLEILDGGVDDDFLSMDAYVLGKLPTGAQSSQS